MFTKIAYMSTTPAPKDNWDHFFDFFFGSTKKVGRTLLAIAIIFGSIYIDQIITILSNLANKVGLMVMNVVNQLLGPAIVLGFIYLGFKKITGKK